MCMYMQNTLTMIQRLPMITVAFIEGKAYGGGAELITACDFRFGLCLFAFASFLSNYVMTVVFVYTHSSVENVIRKF